MNQLTNLNCDTIIFVWYLWFCQEHLAKLMEIMMDMLRGQRCWLMVSEVTELVSTGETWINFNASCSGFIFTHSAGGVLRLGQIVEKEDNWEPSTRTMSSIFAKRINTSDLHQSSDSGGHQQPAAASSSRTLNIHCSSTILARFRVCHR